MNMTKGIHECNSRGESQKVTGTQVVNKVPCYWLTERNHWKMKIKETGDKMYRIIKKQKAILNNESVL